MYIVKYNTYKWKYRNGKKLQSFYVLTSSI